MRPRISATPRPVFTTTRAPHPDVCTYEPYEKTPRKKDEIRRDIIGLFQQLCGIRISLRSS